jgi:protein-tyrosine phosphatase
VAGRDSGDPPPRIDWIDAERFADGLPGRLGLTELPGKQGASLRYPGVVYRRDLDRDLAALRGHGVGRLLLLVEDAELDQWGDADIVRRAAAGDLEVERRPMPDGAAPGSVEEADAIVAWIRRARRDGDLAVACMGGVGRTGTVAACALIDAGLAPEAAITLVRQIRHPTAVETDEQLAFVDRFARSRSEPRT